MNAIKKGLLVVAGVAAVLGGIECLLRIFSPPPLTRLDNLFYLMQPDPLLRYFARSNAGCPIVSETGGTFHVKTNAQGIRDVPYLGKQGRKNILGIGDSFLFGNGVEQEEGMMRRMQEFLDSRSPGRYRTLNAGMPGYATNQEILYYLSRGKPEFDPDAVLIFFYINDLVLHARPATMRYFKGIPIPEQDLDDMPKEIRGQTPWSSLQIVKLFRWWTQRPAIPGGAEPPGRPMQVRPEDLPFEVRIMWDGPYPERDIQIDNLVYMVKQLKDDTEMDGRHLMFVYLPASFESENGLARKSFHAYYDLPDTIWNWDLPNRRIGGALREAGVRVVNLLPAFRDHWNRTARSLYLNGIGHLTPEGHRLAAETIFPELAGMLENATTPLPAIFARHKFMVIGPDTVYEKIFPAGTWGVGSESDTPTLGTRPTPEAEALTRDADPAERGDRFQYFQTRIHSLTDPLLIETYTGSDRTLQEIVHPDFGGVLDYRVKLIVPETSSVLFRVLTRAAAGVGSESETPTLEAPEALI